jgi:hypothetical protein
MKNPREMQSTSDIQRDPFGLLLSVSCCSATAASIVEVFSSADQCNDYEIILFFLQLQRRWNIPVTVSPGIGPSYIVFPSHKNNV